MGTYDKNSSESRSTCDRSTCDNTAAAGGDPRAGDRKAPPHKTKLYWASLTNNEKSVLDAMYEHCSDGSIVWASLPRLARYSKLSRKTVQRALHGDHRNGKLGLIARGIVTQLAPENRGKKRPATYRVNADALAEDPQMDRYKKRQLTLPGIRRTAVPGEPIEPPTIEPPTTVPRSTAPAANYGPTVQGTTVPRSTDSLEPDSLLKTKPSIQHGDAALMESVPRSTLNSMPAWLALKEQLRAELSEAEFDLWVRPMFLLRAMGGGKDKHLLAALPPSGRIQGAAVKRLPMMREMLAPAGVSISLTPYPDEWDVSEAEKRFGIDLAPKPWTRDS